MSPNDVADFFKEIITDDPGDTVLYALMETANTLLVESRPWKALRKLDSSISNTASDTWQTQKTLPVDFGYAHKAYGGATTNPYEEVPYENILDYLGSSNRFAIDHEGRTLRFAGPAGSALTFYLWYIKLTTSLIGLSDVQKASATLLWMPARFRPILAYKMAEIQFGGVDADEITRQMAPADRLAYTELKRAMESWDFRLQRASMGGRTGFANEGDGRSMPDVVSGI